MQYSLLEMVLVATWVIIHKDVSFGKYLTLPVGGVFWLGVSLRISPIDS